MRQHLALAAPTQQLPESLKLLLVVRAGLRLEVLPAQEKPEGVQPQMLQDVQIVTNLVANAIKASPHKETVGLEASVQNGLPRFTVCDRGPGVPNERKSRIFDKYVTGAPRHGTGIGLAFCRVAAQALKGKVWVEDRPGGGSLFIVELPQ